MFVALRDLRHARGRFALMITVLVLVAYLVSFLASLTAGLARESTSAVTGLRADHLAFGLPDVGQSPSFTASTVTAPQWSAWASMSGVASAQPLGVATTRATSSSTTAAVTAFGVQPGSGLVGDPPGGVDVAAGGLVLSAGAADDLQLSPGDTVRLAGETLTVLAVLDTAASYAHTPVVWMTLDDWQGVGARGTSAGTTATVVALKTAPDVDLRAGDALAGTTSLTTSGARSAVASFAAENGSLTIMLGFLLAVSALVVGAFFTVWTLSRSGDVAVLKALGASARYLLRDALGQALLVLVVGVGAGVLLAVGSALALGTVVPVVVGAATTLLPAALLVGLGLVGAAAATAQITRIDPHAALAAR